MWAPCVGPTLGAAVALAAEGKDLGEAALVMVAFGLGISTVLLVIGAFILTGPDRNIEAFALDHLPDRITEWSTAAWAFSPTRWREAEHMNIGGRRLSVTGGPCGVSLAIFGEARIGEVLPRRLDGRASAFRQFNWLRQHRLPAVRDYPDRLDTVKHNRIMLVQLKSRCGS